MKNDEKCIIIESPLFKILSKTKNFGKIFTIFISQEIIDKLQSNEEYKKTFDELNNMDINYASIFFILKDTNKINYLKEINIDFNKIKRLTIYNYDDNIMQKNIQNYFEIIFSFNNIENNLIYLNINFKKCIIDPILFENINNFKSLRYLFIRNINFDKDFIIKLKVLKILSIKSCKNIIYLKY